MSHYHGEYHQSSHSINACFTFHRVRLSVLYVFIDETECPLLHSLDAHIVDKTACCKDSEYSERSIYIIMCSGVNGHTVHDIAPQPLAHQVAVGVDEEYSKSGGTDGIDEPGVRDVQVLEEHKRAYANGKGQDSVGVAHEPIRETVLAHGLVDVERS